MTYTQVSVIEESAQERLSGATPMPWSSGWGEVSVVEKIVGYKKIKFFTHENAGYGDVRLPEMQMHTTAFWLTLPEERVRGYPYGRAAAISGLRGLGRALETVATLALMCDPRDLGATLGEANPDGESADAARPARSVPRGNGGVVTPGYNPTLFLYEHVPGGTGLAERIFEQREVLLSRARRLIESCPCPGGCPSCVGPGGETESERSRKAIALDLLEDLEAVSGPVPRPAESGPRLAAVPAPAE
jgi:DEAD/DEAH box helicase domain-containing protein